MNNTEIIIQNNNMWDNIQLNEYGCFFCEYDNNIRPIFYIKPQLWEILLESYGQKKHKSYDTITTDDYILKIPNAEISILPIPRDTLKQMIYDGCLIENINIENYVEKYKSKFNYINKEYMENIIKMSNHELNNIYHILEYKNIINHYNDDNSDISSMSINLDDDSDNEN
jgi:hypothetical protein